VYKEPYHFNVERYVDPVRFNKIKDFADQLPTPTLVVDLDLIRRKYLELQGSLPMAESIML
jgi:diaminopimelate decarboxylase